MKQKFSKSDMDLKQAVVDKDIAWMEEILARPDCTRGGVAEALYLSASLGMQNFCDMLFHEGNKQSYVDGCLICAIFANDREMFDTAIREGADIHHRAEKSLQVAVKILSRDFADLLAAMGCNIDVAFPPEDLQALFRSASEGIEARKALDLVSEIRAQQKALSPDISTSQAEAQAFQLRLVKN